MSAKYLGHEIKIRDTYQFQRIGRPSDRTLQRMEACTVSGRGRPSKPFR